jgi:P-type Cu+ transporter
MSKSVAAFQTVKDPICGMSVSPDSAAGSFEYNGQTYYFCSEHCLQRFRKTPTQFVESTQLPPTDATARQAMVSAVPAIKAAEYTCPMHPEVRQDRPGSCPKCGMALEPVNVNAPKEKIEYTCPMHPQIVRDAPGFCPICGMALEPRTVSVEEENAELSAILHGRREKFRRLGRANRKYLTKPGARSLRTKQ